MSLRTYYALTKPGIIYGNTFTAAGGFILGAHGNWPIARLLAMLAGIALIMASGCVYNNYIDRGIDAKMKRTQKRALVQGNVSGPAALIYATSLGTAGAVILGLWANALALCIALAGLFLYVVVYGIGKRRTVHGTIIGSLSGAVPPVVGYTAATGQLDMAALLLFLILVFWQMPHFYAIAMFRKDDYAAAGIPVLPVVRGMNITKQYILVYVMLFVGAVIALTACDYTGYTYLVIMGGIGLYWAWRGVRGFYRTDDIRWARGMFLISLVALPAFPIALAINTITW